MVEVTSYLLVNMTSIVTIDKERHIYSSEEDGCLSIAILKDIIVAIGKRSECEEKLLKELEKDTPETTKKTLDAWNVEIVDCTDMLALPGLIDAHCHAGHALVKTLGGGKSRCHKQNGITY